MSTPPSLPKISLPLWPSTVETGKLVLNYKIFNKLYWSDVPGIVYIDVPEDVQDEQITVIAVLLDGPIKLYRGEGQVISVN